MHCMVNKKAKNSTRIKIYYINNLVTHSQFVQIVYYANQPDLQKP